MAIYKDRYDAAEQAIIDDYVKMAKRPVFFAKIRNFGREQWLIDYEKRDYTDANFEILADLSASIANLVGESVRVKYLLSEAVKANRSGKSDQAARIYKEVIVLDPENATALSLLGLTAFLDSSDLEQAAEWFMRAARANCGDVMVYQYLDAMCRSAGVPMPEKYQSRAHDGRTILGPEIQVKLQQLMPRCDQERLRRILSCFPET